MTERLDRLLRHHLQGAALEFEPGHPDGSLGSALSARLRRRRQTRGAVATAAVLSVVMGLALFVRLYTPPAQTLTASGGRPQPPGASAPPGPGGTSRSGDPRGSACSPTCSGTSVDGTGNSDGRIGATGPPTSPTGPSHARQGSSTPTSTPATGPTQSVPTTALAVPTTTVTTSPPTPPTTIGPETFVFTLQDSSRTVSVLVGDTVVLRLSSCVGTTWSTPTSSEPSVLTSEAGSPAPVTGGFTASFLAASSGQSRLASSIKVSACAEPIAHFTLTVVVVSRVSAGTRATPQDPGESGSVVPRDQSCTRKEPICRTSAPAVLG